jgi:hypothetical protein
MENLSPRRGDRDYEVLGLQVTVAGDRMVYFEGWIARSRFVGTCIKDG